MLANDEIGQAVREQVTPGTTSSIAVESSTINGDSDGDCKADDELQEENPFCRLCYGTKYDDSTLIEPCRCKGTVAKVHRQCLEKWLNRTGSKKCDLCLFEFKCEEKLRYGLFQSMRVWIRQQHRRRYFLHDFFLLITMNVITLSMITLLLQVIRNVLDDDHIRENLPFWHFVALCLAAAVWIMIYLATFVIFIHSQIAPWYRWWKSVKKINLIT